VRKGFTCPDVSQYMPDRKFTSVLDILDIDEPCVKAHLIDSRGVEKIILIPTYNDARKVVYQERPHNVDSCYTLQAEQLLSRAGAQLFFGISGGGGGRSRFFDDIGQQIRDAEHSLETNRDQLKVLEGDKKKVVDPANRLGKELEDAKARFFPFFSLFLFLHLFFSSSLLSCDLLFLFFIMIVEC